MGFDRTSALMGGGEIYWPPSMLFDGIDSRFELSDTWDLSTGFSFVCQFDIADFLAATWTNNYVMQASGGSGKNAFAAILSPIDSGNGKLQVQSANSAGTGIFTADWNFQATGTGRHTVLASYDPVAGVGHLYVDGKAGTITLATTGTPDPGLGTKKVGGAGAIRIPDGTIGFVGFHNAYIDFSVEANRRKFFDALNNPVQQDEATWANSGFGTQPLVFNEYGDVSDNHGSAGNFTNSGGVVHAPVTPCPNVRGIATIGDAVSRELPDGKVAWVDAQRIVGTQRNEGIICAADFRGSALALESYSGGQTFGMLYPGCVVTNLGGGLERSPEGAKMYVPGSGFNISDVPAYTNGRHIITTVDLDYNSFSSGLMDININRNASDAFFCRIIWNVSGYWTLQIYSTISAVVTQHASINLASNIEDAYGIVTVSDFGDTIMLGAILYEKGATTVLGSGHTYYYTAARPLKSYTTFGLDFEQTQAIRLQSILAINF